MDKSIILTGNKGLIGSFLEKELNFKGYKVIGIDIESDLSDEDTVKSIKIVIDLKQAKNPQ